MLTGTPDHAKPVGTGFGALIGSWAVVVGATPAGIMLPIAIALAVVVVTAERIKDDYMEANKKGRVSATGMLRSVATKCWLFIRRCVGQSMIIITAMVASMTAGVAGQQS
jgi:hypothetical protein